MAHHYCNYPTVVAFILNTLYLLTGYASAGLPFSSPSPFNSTPLAGEAAPTSKPAETPIQQAQPIVSNPASLGISHAITLRIMPCTCGPDHRVHPESCIPLTQQVFQPGYAQGICVIYHGIYAFTDLYGYVTFAKDHPGNSFDLVITPFIYPVLSRGQVVDHWNQASEIPHRMYHATYQEHMNQTLDHPGTWTIVPFDDEKISADALIILGDPASVSVPQGTFVAESSHQFILPPLCLTQPMNAHDSFVHAVLKTLKYLQYTRPVGNRHQLNHASILSYPPYRLMA